MPTMECFWKWVPKWRCLVRRPGDMLVGVWSLCVKCTFCYKYVHKSSASAPVCWVHFELKAMVLLVSVLGTLCITSCAQWYTLYYIMCTMVLLANVGETMLSRAVTLYQLFARRIMMTKGDLLGNYMAITDKGTPFQELRFLTLYWTLRQHRRKALPPHSKSCFQQKSLSVSNELWWGRHWHWQFLQCLIWCILSNKIVLVDIQEKN